MRVALFVTCVNDTLFPRTGRAVVALLERLGVEVEFPQEQSCCGQPQYNSGYRDLAAPLVRRFGRAFDGYDWVVTPSASCAAMVREHFARVTEEPPQATERTLELTEFLTDVLRVEDVGAYYPHTVTYHPTCHGLRALGLGERPYRLLRAVRGLTLRELPGAEECCGFGGTFAVKNAAVSAAMGADKARGIAATGAEAFCAVDNSCGMHIAGTLSRLGEPARRVHLAEILASTEERQW
ncbi:(Fe-S)-binding protein [Streptomyces sp. DSM 44917]|uniref:(Fe-S)-binding protein n=1 Tax=Streptomyces boetiae TaxID=3075541 RepID=A0ABU2LG18_9ACTN|nr:(Fe-S)-binding protein [Streptomyces sp. DSM 44917]MDT0310533.1 (Fe-S)-binding protein [Streptomyces sp. DSM 44917]